MNKFKLYAKVFHDTRVTMMNYKKRFLTKTELKKAICEVIDNFESSKDSDIDICIGKVKKKC